MKDRSDQFSGGHEQRTLVITKTVTHPTDLSYHPANSPIKFDTVTPD